MKQLKSKDIPELRKKLLEEQNGFCPICNKKIDAPVLDHHHCKKLISGTGQVRGVVCRGCNIFMGKIENSCVRFGISQAELPRVLSNIAIYITSKQLPYIHPTEAPKKPRLSRRSYNKLKKEATVKVPEYTGNYTKKLQQLFIKYKIKPEFLKK